MSGPPVSAIVPPLCRRPLAVLLALLLLSFQLGWHVAATPRAGKSIAERYPCENCACACTSAESCWKSCCCHSDSEKIAWAEANGVEVPEFVRGAIERKQPAASCCSVRLAQSSCCEAGDGDGHESHEQSADGPRTKLVHGWQALKCRGISVDVFAGLGVLVVPPRVEVRRNLIWVGAICESYPLFDSLCYEPLLPPPRG